eukprot:COSAG02_NODE_908_length_16032_cov_53.699931_2_plen_250_part_00
MIQSQVVDTLIEDGLKKKNIWALARETTKKTSMSALLEGATTFREAKAAAAAAAGITPEVNTMIELEKKMQQPLSHDYSGHKAWMSFTVPKVGQVFYDPTLPTANKKREDGCIAAGLGWVVRKLNATSNQAAAAAPSAAAEVVVAPSSSKREQGAWHENHSKQKKPRRSTYSNGIQVKLAVWLCVAVTCRACVVGGCTVMTLAASEVILHQSCICVGHSLGHSRQCIARMAPRARCVTIGTRAMWWCSP